LECFSHLREESEAMSILARMAGCGAAAALLSIDVPAGASVYGPLDNFDVVNDTGHDTCGFEIEIEGVHGADVYRTFDAPYIRYQTPTITDTATGVLIRYKGAWDPATRTFLQKTPPAAPGYVPASDSCWTGGLGSSYDASGCEHFGVSQTTNATSTRYRWLSCNPDGTVSPLADIGLPTPSWTVSPPLVAGDPPVVRAEFEVPDPDDGPYGEAYWVKIYKTEVEHPVALEDLLLDNPEIEGAETEIEWELLQDKPGQGFVFNEAPLAAGAQAVMRRYEFYHYQFDWGRTHTFIDPDTGLPTPYVDPESGEVVECVVDGCNDPTPDELGGYVGRQIAGFNVPPPECSDGIDDDGDGLVDYPQDPGCRAADSYTFVESPVCQNGLDEDGDGLVDFDGGAAANGGVPFAEPDPQCRRAWSGDEAPHCGFGAEVALALGALAGAARRIRKA
jgi:hypothetical protein